MFGIDDPAFALVAEYPPHGITQGLSTLTLFPRAAALGYQSEGDWRITPILSTLERAWTEIGEIADEIRYDEGSDERPGPLTSAWQSLVTSVTKQLSRKCRARAARRSDRRCGLPVQCLSRHAVEPRPGPEPVRLARPRRSVHRHPPHRGTGQTTRIIHRRTNDNRLRISVCASATATGRRPHHLVTAAQAMNSRTWLNLGLLRLRLLWPWP